MAHHAPNEDALRAYAARLQDAPLGKGDSLQDALERIRQKTSPFSAQNHAQTIDYASAKQLFHFTAQRLCERQGKRFVIDDENRWVLQNLVAYLIGDQTNCAFSLHKGIYLYGPVGVGKTFVFQTLRVFCQAVPLPTFTVVPTRQIVQEVEKAKSFTETEKYHGGMVCFDDLGDEPLPTKIYQREENVMALILSQRYEAYLSKGQLTHVTSNLLPSELESHYGSRIADRCRQLFNFVPLGNKGSVSRRG
jgi:chromosomal replication initiation ATPase DnaA